MTGLPTFSVPLDVVRPRGARLLEAFSPKLARRVQHVDRASFRQWVRLEADPGVTAFCERPARIGRGAAGRPIDFWVQRRNAAEFVLLAHGDAPTSLPDEYDGTPLRVVAPAELAAADVWIDNWQRILPVISCAGALVTGAMKKSVLSFVDAPMALSRIERERERGAGDPMLARGAVFELLRTGALAAPSLHTQRLCLHSMIEPVR